MAISMLSISVIILYCAIKFTIYQLAGVYAYSDYHFKYNPKNLFIRALSDSAVCAENNIL